MIGFSTENRARGRRRGLLPERAINNVSAFYSAAAADAGRFDAIPRYQPANSSRAPRLIQRELLGEMCMYTCFVTRGVPRVTLIM